MSNSLYLETTINVKHSFLIKNVILQVMAYQFISDLCTYYILTNSNQKGRKINKQAKKSLLKTSENEQEANNL